MIFYQKVLYYLFIRRDVRRCSVFRGAEMRDEKDIVLRSEEATCSFGPGRPVRARLEIDVSRIGVGVRLSPMSAPILMCAAESVGLGCAWTVVNTIQRATGVIINEETIRHFADIVLGIDLDHVKVERVALDLNMDVDQVAGLYGRQSWPPMAVMKDMIVRAEEFGDQIISEALEAVGIGLIADPEFIAMIKAPKVTVVRHQPRHRRFRDLLHH